MQLKILYEDNHIIAVNKQSGHIVQGDETGDKPLSEWVKDYIKEKYEKEEKQDLMHIAICALFEDEGYFKFEGLDQDGWPHYEYNRNKEKLTHEQQEMLLKKMFIQYIKKL